MTIDWEIEPVPSTPVIPRRPGPVVTRRYRRLRVSRRGLLVAGAIVVAGIVGVGSAVAFSSGDDTHHRAALGTAVGGLERIVVGIQVVGGKRNARETLQWAVIVGVQRVWQSDRGRV